MIETFLASAALGKAKKAITGLLKQPLFYVALLLLAVGTGTYFYLNHQTKEAVKSAVANADSTATIQTYQTKEEAEGRLAPLQEQEQRKAAQTQKDYAHVRTTIITAPSSSRDAQAPRILVDTVNELERLSRSRENPNGVPDAEVHAK